MRVAMSGGGPISLVPWHSTQSNCILARVTMTAASQVTGRLIEKLDDVQCRQNKNCNETTASVDHDQYSHIGWMRRSALRRAAASQARRRAASIRSQRGLQNGIWIECQRTQGIRAKAGPFSIKAAQDVRVLSLALLTCVLSSSEAPFFLSSQPNAEPDTTLFLS